MQSLCKTVRAVRCRKAVSEIVYLQSSNVHSTAMCGSASLSDISRSQCSTGSFNGSLFRSLSHSPGKWVSLFNRSSLQPNSLQSYFNSPTRCMTTVPSKESLLPNGSAPLHDVAPRIKFKRLDKTAGHIMKILDKEAVEAVKAQREVPDIKPGYIIQMKVEVPENKRRVSTLKGIVIARRNAGLNTTFRVRRQVAGIGVESVYPLYSPNIKEIKVLDKNKVRRAKLYYLRDRMNALKRQ